MRRARSRRPAATRSPAPALLNASWQARDPATTSRAAAGRKSATRKPAGRPSRRPPEIARDSVVHLKGDSYPFQDRDLGRVLRPALATE